MVVFFWFHKMQVVERINVATTTACTGPNDHVAGWQTHLECIQNPQFVPPTHTSFPSLLTVLNCVRLLTRLIPFLFEDSDWRLLFWSPANFSAVGHGCCASSPCHVTFHPPQTQEGEQPQALAQVLLNSLAVSWRSSLLW